MTSSRTKPRFAFRHLALLLGTVVATGSIAAADELAQLQGAWTMSGTECDATFKKGTNGKINFIDRASGLTTGVLIDGSKISAPQGHLHR